LEEDVASIFKIEELPEHGRKLVLKQGKLPGLEV
jgi:hypothetical protein